MGTFVIYLLDTNTCILYLTRRNSAVVEKLMTIPRQFLPVG
ncbi:hypothetical protein MC7420_5188 [Coleofasciculus chthonoplastes PCC 7420]|uniref:Uncharacterized protein n=1 Tax=Coleofasciculus chthonoplastes PCC 7420 TaxID=118168 RepID=B4W2P6_9CYAN|nr:hypothetical protein MC7420_5188 [Coleofasciculus chthonoplastes PCC 7420]